MFRGSAAVDSAYIYIRPANSNEVYKYIIQQDMWIQLQDCPYQQSGLVMMNNCLMSVGGYTSSYVPTNKLFCLRGEEWKEQFPSMNTARFSPALAVQQHYLIVIGGYNQYCYSIASVEILDAESIKWSMLGNLPCPLDWPSATLCGEQLYVLAGKSDGEGYCCSLQELSTSSVLPPSLTWTPFPQPPVSDSTIATLSGVPVVVGGRGRGTGIYNSTVYALLDGQWVECGHLNEARSDCLVASLNTSHMLVVVGGIAFPGLVSATVQLCSVV